MIIRPLEKKALSEIRTFIETHYGEPVTVRLLAEKRWQNDQVSFRPRRLHDTFTALFLQTIHDYLTQVRMERARTLLETTDLGIKAIAASVGYTAESTFGPAFKKYFGINPSGYRNSLPG